MEGLLGALGENVSGVDDLLENLGVGRLDVGEEGSLEGLDLIDVDPVAVALDTDEEGGDDLLGLLGLVLALLEELVEADSAVELLLGGGVEVGAELGEGGDLTVLGELELHGAGDLLHGLDLGGGADAGHGETDVDGGADALVEELGLEEDLAVGDGDHVGGDVGGHVAGLGLDDGEGGEGAATEVVGASWRRARGGGSGGRRRHRGRPHDRGATEEEGHLAVGDGLLGEVVVEDDGVLAVVAEVLSHGAARCRGRGTAGGGVGRGGGDNDGVVHGARLVERLHELGDGGTLLADGDVDAVERLGVAQPLTPSG